MCSRKSSEPIPIPSRSKTFTTTPISEEELTIITERIKTAARIAKNELSLGKDIQSSVPILDHASCSIVINELKKDGEVFLVVYKNEGGGKSKILFREVKDRWRFIFFKNITSSRVFVNCKLLKVMFEECKDCIISLRSPIIGSSEFLRCKDMNLTIRIHTLATDLDDCPPIPFTRIELCNEFTILQSNPVLIYLINSSHNITGIMVDTSGIRQAQHELGGKLFWDEQEQTIISFSKKEGFVSVPFYYALNDITGNIIVSPLETVEEEPSFFNPTPPLSFS